MGLVAGSAMQWLTLEPAGDLLPPRICCSFLATSSPWASRCACLHHPDVLAFVPFLRLLGWYRRCGCCAGSWRRGSSPADGECPWGSSGCLPWWGFTADIRLALRPHWRHGVLMALLALPSPASCVPWQSAHGPHALRLWPSITTSPVSGAVVCSSWRVSPGPDAVPGCGRREVDLLRIFPPRLPADAPEPLPGQCGGLAKREGILADLHPGRGHHLDLYPMVRGRLTRIAGRRWSDAARRVDREPNHHHIGPCPPTTSHRQVNGWPGREVPSTKALADGSGIALGDVLGFTHRGAGVSKARVTSLEVHQSGTT